MRSTTNQVSCTPSHDGRRAARLCSVLMSPGAIERLMPSTPSALHVAEIVLELLAVAGVAVSVTGTPPRSTTIVERLAGADADDALHVGETVDLAAVDRQHQIARLEAGGRGGAAGLHGVDARGGRSACRRP